MMEENRDTAGWGIIGTLWAIFATVSPTVLQQIGTAALIAGGGWLGSYTMKKIVTYLEGRVDRWKEDRKNKTNIE